MNYSLLKWCTILLPTLLIGGFEFIRHMHLLPYLSMEAGNVVITILTFLLSAVFATWMFGTIRKINERLIAEQARHAVYEERERLARDLHDGIAQTVFFLGVKLKQGHLDEAKSAVADIDRHVRQAIFNLRSVPDAESSLHKRINKWLAEWTLFTNIEVTQDIRIPENFFTPAEDILLFGIIQEAFANIRKHAEADRAELVLQALPGGGFELTICDDGRGFNPEQTASAKYGLSMLRERAAGLGAELSIGKHPGGRGTQLTLRKSQGGTRP